MAMKTTASVKMMLLYAGQSLRHQMFLLFYMLNFDGLDDNYYFV